MQPTIGLVLAITLGAASVSGASDAPDDKAAVEAVIIDGSAYAGSPEARALMGHEATDPAAWQWTAAESIVLRKINATWKMVLGHSSVIPTKRK